MHLKQRNIYTTIPSTFFLLFLVIIIVFACKSTTSISSKTLPYKRTELSREQLKSWPLMDLSEDSIPGISYSLALSNLERKKSNSTVVAVIDTGIKTSHPLLKPFIWENEDEIPENNLDDDKNGYVDDSQGWNFLGEVYYVPFEITRIIAKGNSIILDKGGLANESEEFSAVYQDLRSIFIEESNKAKVYYKQVSKVLNRQDVTDQDYDLVKRAEIAANYHYNPEYDPLGFLKSDCKGLDCKNIGNNMVQPIIEEEIHGTLVSGVIAQIIRLSKADVSIMALRAIPNGDEYDQIVASAIFYAVNNGAKVINMSFGKSYSQYPELVAKALLYASENDVLVVHAAGDDALNLNSATRYPNDTQLNRDEVSESFISVGAIRRYYNSKVVFNSSNYGSENVDLFAPGEDIFSSTTSETWDYFSATSLGQHEFASGTFMAAPFVSAVASLIRSYYPNLSAKQVKQILLDSGRQVPFDVIIPGSVINKAPLSHLCKSGRILDAHQAILMSEKLSLKD